MCYTINVVSGTVKNLVAYCESEGIEVTVKTIQSWIEDILESLTKEDIAKVASYLLKNENTKENLLKVYSFVNSKFNEKVS